MQGVPFTYFDIAVIAVLAFHIARSIRHGLFPPLSRVASFALGLAAAFAAYQPIGAWAAARFPLFPQLAYGLVFIAVFTLAQALAHAVLIRLFMAFPDWTWNSALSRLLAVAPAFVDGAIMIAMIVLLASLLPLPTWARSMVLESRTGVLSTYALQGAEQRIERAFGGAVNEALTFFTTKVQSTERVDIPYKPKSLAIDARSEERMLALVNAERAKAGAPPLVPDEAIREVARAHSRDMWARQYFSHVNPDGADPFDRMRAGGARYLAAGENLAFAPTVDVAHRGLMNSPGHKRNILDPSFRRVGIGVVDGGPYGKMYTQNFAD